MPPVGDYPQPSYSIYGPPPPTVPLTHRLTAPGAYDDIDIRDSYYPDDRPLSRAALTPMVGIHNLPRMRHRRHSTVSFITSPPAIDAYRRPSSINIKFKRKGAFLAGITLAEAQSSHVRLSGNDLYTTHDFHAGRHRTIYLRVKWTGYTSLTYEIPLDVHDGRVSMQSLARRVSRACVHYLQANVIPVPWDRVELHHLEEVSYGVWQPMLSTC